MSLADIFNAIVHADLLKGVGVLATIVGVLLLVVVWASPIVALHAGMERLAARHSTAHWRWVFPVTTVLLALAYLFASFALFP